MKHIYTFLCLFLFSGVAVADIAYCHNSMLQQFYSASDGICFSSDMEITKQEFTNRQLDSSRYGDNPASSSPLLSFLVPLRENA